MGLDEVRKVFEKSGRDDAMYAVLTSHRHRGNRWDPDEFFQLGRDEIAGVMEYVASHGWPLERGSALDFGCGVGRLTQALAERFDSVTGIDISHTMIEQARRHDRSDGRISWLVNTKPDLGLLGAARFDFVYSSITLQHIPPVPAAAYVAELVRVLRPGGIAIFQTRNGPRITPGTFGAWLYALRREHLRRLWQRIRGRIPYEIHHLARAHVEEIVATAGGRMLDVADMSAGRPGRSLRYCATRPAGTGAPAS